MQERVMNQSHKVMVGIDVSKDKLDIAVTGKKVKQIPNTLKAIKEYFKRLRRNFVVERVIFEATGGYEKKLIVAFEYLSLDYARVHGTAVHHFIKAKGQLGKTDVQDALSLLAYAEWITEDKLKEGAVSSQHLRLQEWHSRIEQLKSQRQAERNRAKSTLLEVGVLKDIKASIEFLTQQIEVCKEALQEVIQNDEDLKKLFERLQTMPGVGYEMASAWICYGQNLIKGCRESASAFCGVAPLNRDSGKYQGYRSTGHGPTGLKRMLYMTALVGIRYNAILKNYYLSLLERHKKPLVALIACSRKVLLWLRVMHKDGIEWNNMKVYKNFSGSTA